MSCISQKNQYLRKENEALKSRIDKIEQDQLWNNILLTGIPEGPFEPYNITKLCIQEMIVVTLNSGNATDDLELSYKFNGFNHDKWHNEGYDLCFDGVREKFVQNKTLLSLLKMTAPKTLAKAMTDRLLGTGIALKDTNALNPEKWASSGWLSKMLISIRDEL